MVSSSLTIIHSQISIRWLQNKSSPMRNPIPRTVEERVEEREGEGEGRGKAVGKGTTERVS